MWGLIVIVAVFYLASKMLQGKPMNQPGPIAAMFIVAWSLLFGKKS